jgi:regulator of RNase E activity RraB
MFETYTKKDENGEKVTIEIDLDIAHSKDKSLKKKSLMLWLFIKTEELDNSMQNEIIEFLESTYDALYIGKRIAQGWSELYFYAQDNRGYSNKTGTFLQNLSDLAYEVGSHKDPSWKQYEVELYPDEVSFHQIQSQHIIDALQDEGDDITIERSVDHIVYFQLEAQVERFVKSLYDSEFFLKEQGYDSSAEYGYGLVLSRIHAVDIETIEKIQMQIMPFIKDEHGYYDGWNTQLASDNVEDDEEDNS